MSHDSTRKFLSSVPYFETTPNNRSLTHFPKKYKLFLRKKAGGTDKPIVSGAGNTKHLRTDKHPACWHGMGLSVRFLSRLVVVDCRLVSGTPRVIIRDVETRIKSLLLASAGSYEIRVDLDIGSNAREGGDNKRG